LLVLCGPGRWIAGERRERPVEEVHVYVNRPASKGDPSLGDVEEALKSLDYVLGVDSNPGGNVVAVTYEGGREERAGIQRAVEEAGYEVSRLSVRSDFEEEPNLWDI
jgi:copper chaperone CopZ